MKESQNKQKKVLIFNVHKHNGEKGGKTTTTFLVHEKAETIVTKWQKVISDH